MYNDTIFCVALAGHFRRKAAEFSRMLNSGLLEPGRVEQWQHDLEDANWAAAQMAEKVSDADLIRAYQETDGDPGNPAADALLVEIKHRDLDL